MSMSDDVHGSRRQPAADHAAEPSPHKMPRSVRESLRGLGLTLRSAPLGRMRAWLGRARGLAPPPMTAVAPSLPQTSVEQGTSRSMLPSHLPVRPRGLSPDARRLQSRRRRKRLGLRRLAWELTEWQVAAFDLWELHGSQRQSRWERELGPHSIAPAQQLAIEALVADNMRFVRLVADIRLDAAGRGHATMREQILGFERQLRVTTSPAEAMLAEAAVQTAIPVKTDRVALCDPAGQVHPEEVLPAPRARKILGVQSRVREDTGGKAYPRSCFLVSEREERKLRRRLLETGMARLVEESDIPLGPDGKLILAGMCCVQHKVDHDRLIVDRRPANALEERLCWSSLPLGSQLTRIVLPRGTVLRGSGDDLRTYFHCLRKAPEAVRRTCVGRVISGAEAEALGGCAQKRYRIGLLVIAMGDTNAVDVANECHRSVLSMYGCLNPANEVIYGNVFHTGPVFEGVYIDDHFVLSIVDRAEADEENGDDCDIVDWSHVADSRSKRVRAEEKGYGSSATPDPVSGKRRGASEFTVLGTEVCSDPGVVGTSMKKRGELFVLTLRMTMLPWIEKGLLRRGLALFTQPFMHRRCLMACLQAAFRWCDQMELKQCKRWDAEILDEIVAAALLLPVAHGNVRWPVAPRVVCTDATVERGGTVATYGSEALTLQLYRFTEHRGGRVRLFDDGSVDPEGKLLPVFPGIRELTGAMRWHATRSERFRILVHISAQELEEVVREVKQLANLSLAPARVLSGQDNMVTMWCWAKGRSGSHTLNRKLRSSIGWQVLGRKTIPPFRLDFADNAGDDPSRAREVREPQARQPWMDPWLEVDPSSTITRCVAALTGEAVVCPAGIAADEWGARFCAKTLESHFRTRGRRPDCAAYPCRGCAMLVRTCPAPAAEPEQAEDPGVRGALAPVRDGDDGHDV